MREDRVDERDDRHDQGGRDERRRELAPENATPDQPVEAAPLLARRVPEAVLDERVVARQPDEQRQEVGGAR